MTEKTAHNNGAQGGLWLGILRRIGLGLLTLWGASVITFALMFLVPANPAQSIGGEHATEQVIQNIEKKYHLNEPAVVQYSYFVKDVLTNELRSYRNEEKVLDTIAARFPATMVLALSGLAVWMLISIPLGTLTAV